MQSGFEEHWPKNCVEANPSAISEWLTTGFGRLFAEKRRDSFDGLLLKYDDAIREIGSRLDDASFVVRSNFPEGLAIALQSWTPQREPIAGKAMVLRSLLGLCHFIRPANAMEIIEDRLAGGQFDEFCESDEELIGDIVNLIGSYLPSTSADQLFAYIQQTEQLSKPEFSLAYFEANFTRIKSDWVTAARDFESEFERVYEQFPLMISFMFERLIEKFGVTIFLDQIHNIAHTDEMLFQAFFCVDYPLFDRKILPGRGRDYERFTDIVSRYNDEENYHEPLPESASASWKIICKNPVCPKPIEKTLPANSRLNDALTLRDGSAQFLNESYSRLEKVA